MRKFVKFLTPSPALLIIRATMKMLATTVAITAIVLVLNFFFGFLPREVSPPFAAAIGAILCWLAYCALSQNPYLNWRNQLFYGKLDVNCEKEECFYQLCGAICLEYIYRSHRIDFEVVIIQADYDEIMLPKKHMNGTERFVKIPFEITALAAPPIAIILRDKNYHREEKILLNEES